MIFLSWGSRVGVLKSRQLGFLQLWSPITLRADLGLKCGLKQGYSSYQVFFNIILHVLCIQVNRVDSWLFLVDNQINSLTPGPSFSHNLCFKCPNEECEPILDIYVPRSFQWYKKCNKPLNFGPWNCSFKFRKSTRTLFPKVGIALGVWGFTPSILPRIFLHSREYVMWFPGFFLARTLATSLP